MLLEIQATTLNAEINRSEEHTSELQSLRHLVCRLLLEKKKKSMECFAGQIPPPLRPCETLEPHATSPPSVDRTVRPCHAAHPPAHTFFFLNDRAPTEIYPLPLHAPLPIPPRLHRLDAEPVTYTGVGGQSWCGATTVWSQSGSRSSRSRRAMGRGTCGFSARLCGARMDRRATWICWWSLNRDVGCSTTLL